MHAAAATVDIAWVGQFTRCLADSSLEAFANLLSFSEFFLEAVAISSRPISRGHVGWGQQGDGRGRVYVLELHATQL